MEQIKSELLGLIRKNVSRFSINDEKDYDRSLRELGVDSLDMMSILLAISDMYKVEISDEEAQEMTSINLLSSHIKNELKKRA